MKKDAVPSKPELENFLLRQKVAAMERTCMIDAASTLTARHYFFELAQGEFRRARRYGHDMTLVLSEVIPPEEICSVPRAELLDQMIAWIAQSYFCISRMGADILGRTESDQIAVLLPQTSLGGGLICMDRLREIAARKPIPLALGENVRAIIKVHAEALRGEDMRFADIFRRAKAGLAARRAPPDEG